MVKVKNLVLPALATFPGVSYKVFCPSRRVFAPLPGPPCLYKVRFAPGPPSRFLGLPALRRLRLDAFVTLPVPPLPYLSMNKLSKLLLLIVMLILYTPYISVKVSEPLKSIYFHFP